MDAMEKIWKHSFAVLGIDPMEHPIMVVDHGLCRKSDREKTLQLLFETFKVPAVYFAIATAMVATSQASATAIALETGEGVTECVPMYDNYTLPHALYRRDFGGDSVSAQIRKLLADSGTPVSLQTARDIKEKHSFLPVDAASAASSSVDKVAYEMPDGRTITLGKKERLAPELLFNDAEGIEQPLLQNIIKEVIMKVDVDIRDDLSKNIIISGGNTLFPGFPERLQSELSQCLPPVFRRLTVRAPPQRKFLAWKGAAILASLSHSQRLWIRYSEYIEEGNDTNLAWRKCW